MHESFLPLVKFALSEDVGTGDVTTLNAVPANVGARAAIVAKQPGVVSGIDIAGMTFREVDASVKFKSTVRDGQEVPAGAAIATVSGSAASVMTAERTALNFLMRLSGVATLTRAYVKAVEGTGAIILDTRKTTPGLRALEKYAVRCGGGFNHRFGLDDAMLIKDNHIAVAGGIRAVLERARASAGHLVKIEIEVDDLDQLAEVLAVGLADAVLLDNMNVADMRKAVAMVGGRFPLEASGSITLESIEAVASAGVDYASSGWITHSAPNLDVGLDIEI